jgi:uncharacterized protein YoaH (UPF0181 family)
MGAGEILSELCSYFVMFAFGRHSSGKAAATAAAAIRAWEQQKQQENRIHIIVSDIDPDSITKFSAWGATTGVCSCRSVRDTLAFLGPYAPAGCDLVVSVANCR